METEGFIIDTAPSLPHEDIDIPEYGVSRKSIELIKSEEKTPQRTRPQSLNPCWNCGKPFHSIRECQANSNSITVEWNKELQTLIKENYGNMKNSARYHDHEKVNKYAHIVPGTLSQELRRMMGLSGNDLPPFIYRLRKHGYPKAWLRHASVKPSGINVYDALGNEVADPDAEEGEILEEEDKIRYDLSKLIKFPGFNAPLPEGAVDNHDMMDAPAFNEFHSLEHMIDDLQEKAVTEYRLKKNTDSSISETTPKLNGNSKETDSNKDENDLSVSQICSTSESLNSQNSQRLPLPSEETVSSQSDVDMESIATVLQNSQESTNEDTLATPTPSTDSLGRVLTCSEGTPILRSRSKHTRLPPAENFSKDICDVINFENLPESTGKFEKMRDILKKVKQVLSFRKQNT